MSTVGSAPTIAAVDPVDAARDGAATVAAGALDGEKLRRLPDATVAALRDRRLFSVLVPRHLGGYDAGPTALIEVVEEISRADGSAGWCTAIGNTTNAAMARWLDDEGAVEVFGQDGARVAAGALAPTAHSVASCRGFRVTGRGTWASGSAHASWYVIGARLDDERDSVVRMHVVPMADCTQVDTWKVAGLRGTGSGDVVVDDVTVPAERCYEVRLAGSPFAASYGLAPADGHRPGDGEWLAESAVIATATIAGFALGVARRSLDELQALASSSGRTLGKGALAEDDYFRAQLAGAAGRLNAARARLVGALDEMVTAADPAAVRVDVAEASLEGATAARAATLFAFDAAPASVVFLDHPIQRCLRDLLVGLKHVLVSPAMRARVGQARLGIPGHGL